MPFDILTNRYDNGRAGVNAAETVLRPSNVGTNTFGKLFTRTVDGDLYAQPLVVGDLWIGSAWRNVVILATSRNWVYAYDADDPAAHVPLWTRQIGPPVPRQAISPTYANFGGQIGITGTPVIERSGDGGTIFLAAKSYRPGRGEAGFAYRLHSLDLLSGEDRARPVLMEAAVDGRPALRLSPFHNLNRPGLLLQDGVVYVAFGSHDDEGPYYGWILAYDASTLRRLAAYNTAPDLGEGGIWQSGTGLAGDGEGHVYAVVGNGKGNDDPLPEGGITAPVYGNAILKLKLDREAGLLRVVDWYTASDVLELNRNDEDLVGGPVLFEQAGRNGRTRRYVLGGGKDGKFYLADRNHMGHWVASGVGNILQAQKVCEFHIHGAPVVWVRSNEAISAFAWSEQDHVKALLLKRRAFGPTPYATSVYGLPRDEYRMPGGILTLSWDGRDPETAILWASHSTRDNAMNKTVAGTLRAFKADAPDHSADGLLEELWTSDMDASGNDRLGDLAKFSPPVVANGKVYVGTFSRELAVYGLLESGGKRRDTPEYGVFQFRGVGDGALQVGGLAGGRYSLRLSGKGLGLDADRRPLAKEGFLFANLQRNMAAGTITITARLRGVNAAAEPSGCVGLLLRRDVQTFGGHPQESVGYAAILVRQTLEAEFLVRDHVPLAAPADQLEPVRSVGIVDGLGLPMELRLTIRSAEDRLGVLTVVAELASPRRAGFRPIGPAAGAEVRFDADAADMDVYVGLFATAQRDADVSEDAAAALAYFSDVSVA